MSVNKNQTDHLNFILNWPMAKKCMLILILAFALHALWIGWKVYLHLTPETWQFVNIELIKSENINNIFAMILLIELFVFCWYFRDNYKASTFFSYFSVYCFTLALCREAYLSGLMSPAMGVTLVVTITIGRLLFNRFLIYSAALLGFGSILVMLHLTIEGVLPYAPIFAGDINADNADNMEKLQFWSYSMLLFTLPTMIAGILLLEILLIDWQRRENYVQELSVLDSLTNIYNRRAIGQFLSQLVNKEETEYPNLNAIILLDLDHFKMINDNFGHSQGDVILIETAKILSANIRKGDLVGRYGGEEFIIILSHIPNTRLAGQVAERCRQQIAELVIMHEGQKIPITASFGVINFFDQTSKIDHLFNLADAALYKAKANGRNQVVTH